MEPLTGVLLYSSKNGSLHIIYYATPKKGVSDRIAKE